MDIFAVIHYHCNMKECFCGRISASYGKVAMAMVLIAVPVTMCAGMSEAYVVDEATGSPLSGASVFDRKGVMLGTCSADGRLPFAPVVAYPLTVRCMGYKEATIASRVDTVLRLKEIFRELPEVVVNARDRQVLHMLAYVREYSTLTTYSDTVTLYRDKWVDFMIPERKKLRFNGWRLPRVLSAKSYYRFSNGTGLDSVSDRFNQHFSWSDWIGVIDRVPVPRRLAASSAATDTLFGKYSPTETWRKSGNGITLDVNVLADTVSRRWMPNMSLFFKNDIDFECVKVKYKFNDAGLDYLSAGDLSGISVNIESNGRGRDMFQFHRRDEPFFVSTYAEIYFADKEYLSVKDARKWEKYDFNHVDFALMPLPDGVPELQPDISQLIARVDNIDHTGRRLLIEPDKRLAGRDLTPLTFKQRILKRLKSMLNIGGGKTSGSYNNSGNIR